MKQTLGNRIAPLFLLFAVASLSGCVYYNTFYNALKGYDEADQRRIETENAPGTQDKTRAIYAYRDLYMKSIRKASFVLDRHPKSKWVDDSLLLIGKAFYWRGSYTEALLKFQELQNNFPRSEHLMESFYWQGLSLWAADRIGDARPVLEYVSTNGGEDFSGKSRLALARMEAEEGNYEAAITAYRALLESGQQKKLRAEIWQGIGHAQLQMNLLSEALDSYRKVLKADPDIKVNYQTRLQIGHVLERLNKLDEALVEYKRILKNKRLRSYQPEVQLKQANVYRLKGDLDTAVQTYESVIENNQRTDESAEAYYRMALIEKQQRKNMVRAKELFEESRKQKPGSEAGIAAREWEQNLGEMLKHQKSIEKDDEKSLEALVNLAELYLLELAEPDSALATYRKVLGRIDSTHTEFAPKALYAIALIEADSLKNTVVGNNAFLQLIDEYPTSPYAAKARERLQQNRTDDALAEARFLEAEALQKEGVDPDAYLAILRQLPSEYPRSLYAPKALYTLAWTYENRLANLDTARVYYRRLVDQYPLTAFARVAEQKLEGDYLQEALPDSTATVAPEQPPNNAAAESLRDAVTDSTGAEK
ncbi:MAG: tetratricopeptide repeat protein [bacterium]|nr:tetratricopeptide repeat protein [bacterium]